MDSKGLAEEFALRCATSTPAEMWEWCAENYDRITEALRSHERMREALAEVVQLAGCFTRGVPLPDGADFDAWLAKARTALQETDNGAG